MISSDKLRKIKIKKLRRLSKDLMSRKRSQKSCIKRRMENFRRLRKMMTTMMMKTRNPSLQRSLSIKINLVIRMMLLRSP